MAEEAPTTVPEPAGVSALRPRRRRDRPAPAFHRAFPTWFAMIAAVHRSEPAMAADLGLGSAQITGNKHAVWIVNALISGVASMAVAAAAVVRAGDDVADGRLSASNAATLAFLFSLLYLVGRTFAIIGTTAARGRKASFSEAASLASVGFAAAAPLSLVALVATALPGLFTTVLLVVATVYAVLLAETSVYIAVARYGRFVRSAAAPHAAFTAAWLCVVTFVVHLVAGDAFLGTLEALL